MSTESQDGTAGHHPRRGGDGQPRFTAVAIAAVIAAAGAAIVVRGLSVGFGGWRTPHTLVFAAGVLLCAVGLFMFQRGLRRQARLRAIAELLPHYRERMRYRDMADAAAAHTRRFGGANDWSLDEGEWADEGTEAPLARAEMRAATRALLVSLEEEIRHETAARRKRTTRPACRRVRLRAAGRAKTERRRVIVLGNPRRDSWS